MNNKFGYTVSNFLKSVVCLFAGHVWKTFPAVKGIRNGQTTYICMRCNQTVSHDETYIRN